MAREIKKGDVLIRYLLPFGVWHFGIVIEVKNQNINDILLLEFSDGEKVTRITLIDFMYQRHYFWIEDFNEEYIKYGPSVFYTINERVERAKQIANKGGLSYTINKYNCEYFVRRCVFKDTFLWKSVQTEKIGEYKINVIGKIALMLIYSFSIAGDLLDTSYHEVDQNPTNYKYIVCYNCGGIIQLPLKLEYKYLECICKNHIKLRN